MDIVCKNLSYRYNKNTEFSTLALDGVTLSIAEGEFFGVIGHTGSGKSTFIQHLNALFPLQEGELTIGDFDLKFTDANGKKNKKRQRAVKSRLKALRKNVGMVFQYPEYQLFADTVFEDVSFGLKNFTPDLTDEEVKILTRNAIETVGLNYFEVKDKSPFDLSGGQKRRVAIAGVLATKPSVLILDEPCAGLDPQGKTELWALLHRLHKDVIKTIIIVSHDMNDVANHCTKAVIFDKGKVVKVGAPQELFSDSELIESCGLEVPVTAYLTENLKKSGVTVNTDYRLDDFIANLAITLNGNNN